MAFLNPVYLWFLPLLAIPVIIHLLAKRKSKLIDFPSLKFLKLLEQDALRKFNLKQLLLLILRTLMLLLLILAFSRPTLKLGRQLSLSLGSTNLVIIVLDNTASTSDYFKDVSAPWIDDLANQLREKDYQVLFADLATFSLGAERSSIQPGFAAAYPFDVSQRLAAQIDADHYSQKVLVWSGDGQHASDIMEMLPDWDIYIHTLPVTRDQGISVVDLPPRGVQMGQDIKLTIAVSSGAEDDLDQTLELIVNEERQNQRILESGKSSVTMSAQIKESGFQLGRLVLGEDAFPYNDIRHFVLPAQGRIPFQVLRSIKAMDYWAAIGAALEKLSLNLEVHLVDIAQVDDLNLSGGGSVLVEDAALIADYTWDRFRGFLERGGQLILFGDGGQQMADLLGLRMGVEEQTFAVSTLLTLTASGRDVLALPPLEKVVGENRLKIYKRYVHQSNELQNIWIRFADDQPFLGSSDYGQGQVIWFNTDFGGNASNLQLLGVFPPLMLRLGQAVQNSDQTAAYNFEVGDTIRFQPEATGRTEPFAISRPDGGMDYSIPDSNFVLTYANTDVPGIYQLQRGRQIVQPVAVNISSNEAAAHGQNYSFDPARVYHSTSASALIKEVLETQTGLPLWPLLLLILLLVWMLETYLSRIRNTWRHHD